MRHLIYIFVIISLSFTVNAQLKSKSLTLENDHKQTFKSVSTDEKSGARSISPLAIEFNRQGIKKVLVENDLEQALPLFQKAVDIDYGCFNCRYNLGMSFLGLGNLDTAIEIFTSLTGEVPNYANAFAGLGDTLGKKGRHAEAVAAYRQALKLENNDPYTYCNLGTSLHQMGEHKEALKYFGEAIRQKPDLVKAHNNRGVTLYALDRMKEALKNFEKADSIQPNTPEILNNIGVTLGRLGKKKEAHNYFEEVLRLQPDYAPAIYNLALSFQERGNRGAAQQQLKSLEGFDFVLADKLRKALWQKFVVDASELKNNY